MPMDDPNMEGDPMAGGDPNMDGSEIPMDDPNMEGDPMMGGEGAPMEDPMDGESEGDDSTSSIINQLAPEDREAVRAYAQSMLSKSKESNDGTQQEPMMESFVFTKNQLTKIMENFNQSVDDSKNDNNLKKKESKTVSKKSPFNSPKFD
jgi:hypothetical protein